MELAINHKGSGKFNGEIYKYRISPSDNGVEFEIATNAQTITLQINRQFCDFPFEQANVIAEQVLSDEASNDE